MKHVDIAGNQVFTVRGGTHKNDFHCQIWDNLSTKSLNTVLNYKPMKFRLMTPCQ